MPNANDLFARMCKEAQDELASGKRSWRDMEANALILACFGMLTNHLTHKLSRPLWFFASSVAAGVIGYLVRLVLGG